MSIAASSTANAAMATLSKSRRRRSFHSPKPRAAAADATAEDAKRTAEAFVEISVELAQELGIVNLDWTVLSTARGAVEVKALVTQRLRPFLVDDKVVHEVGMPWVFGWEGYAQGAIANVLLAIHGDPNTSIHTTKALTCSVRKGRLLPAKASAHD